MTDTTIFERYLTDSQMAEIAAEEWRAMCRTYFASAGPLVAIKNVAYSAVKQAVDEALGGSADKLIAEKAIGIINDLSTYVVFHAPDVWDKEPSESWKVLQRVVRENEDLVRDQIRRHIHNISKADALAIIKSAKLTIETGARK